MLITKIQSCRTRKRKKPNKLDTLQCFGNAESMKAMVNSSSSDSFRDNIRSFLHEYAQIQDYTVEGNPVWSTLLVNDSNGVIFPIYTVEETIRSCSSRPFCDHCRYVGWSHHFLSKQKYHLIIPVDGDWNTRLKDDTLELYSHLLHAVIHCNGFGHLLCISGPKEGPNSLSSDDVMNLFDRLCTLLQTRKITVRDLSVKGSMDLRLLHGVAYRQPWFGKWGYKFCNGSFGVTRKMYDRSMQILSALELDKITDDFEDEGEEVGKMISSYKDLSENPLTTFGELIRFMLGLKSKAPKKKATVTGEARFSSIPTGTTLHLNRTSVKPNQAKFERFVSSFANLSSRWPSRRLVHVAEVIVNILREQKASGSGKTGMTRQELRDAVRKYIGDTGLIDFVLKTMGSMESDFVIRRRSDAVMLEFFIDDGCSEEVRQDEEVMLEETEVRPLKRFKKEETEAHLLPSESGFDVYHDVLYLYNHVLLEYPNSDLVTLAARAILDSKQFVKEWVFSNECANKTTRLICRVLPHYEELVTELTRPLPPGEPVVVPQGTTVGQLKLAAQRALRDTYCIMDQFKVNQIGGLNGRDEDEVLTWAEELGGQVWVRGSGLDMYTKLRYEGGPCDGTVNCVCGAKDDDGERMIACDVCRAWQHTRCYNIDEDEASPKWFSCSTCSLKANHVSI